MSSNENDTRTVLTLATGSKICLLVAVPFLMIAAYFLWAPITIPGSNGGFGCQSAFNPPTEQFPKNVCGTVNHLYQLRAGLALAASLLIAAGGTALFGVNRRVEQRKVREARPAHDESLDED